jgi:hypothetical protein
MLKQQQTLHLVRSSARAVFVASILLCSAGVAASPNDELNEKIHAAACEPALGADRAKLDLATGGWTFATGQTGTIKLNCPIYTPYWDEDFGFRNIVELRMWYRDTDGASNVARVNADLILRDFDDSAASFVAGVSSNSSATTTHTTIAATLNPHPMVDAQYSVVITMFRANTTKNVVFRGISFREISGSPDVLVEAFANTIGDRVA